MLRNIIKNNIGKRKMFFFAVIMLFTAFRVEASANFPPPDFESDYEMPGFVLPDPFPMSAILDVTILFVALSFASWLSIKKRSRRGLFITMLLCMGYFGFIRKGCVCPIGAIQNVSLSIFNQDYVLAWPVLAFFALPIIFSLFFGRVFCGVVCPLGAIQDLVVLRPMKVPVWLENILQMIAWLFLALAILLAATGSAFIICRFDPFISIYRFTSSFDMMVLTGTFLIMSMLIGRPYCRFICPYGVILRQMSRLSKWKMSIVPVGKECIQCKLCVEKCPFDAINAPYKSPVKSDYSSEIKKFLVYSGITVVLVLICGIAGYKLGERLSYSHPAVQKSAIVQGETVSGVHPSDQIAILNNIEAQGQDKGEIIAFGDTLINRYRIGSALILGFLGVVVGFKLIKTIIYRNREDYEVDEGKCLYCGRCLDACPNPVAPEPQKTLRNKE